MFEATPAIPRDPAQETPIPVAALHEFFVQVLTRFKMFAAEATLVADRLIDAERFGYPEFGTPQLLRILEAMELGNIDARAQIVPLSQTAACAVLDAGKGVGEAAASRAIKQAIEHSAEVGTYTVLIRNSQSLGAPSSYARIAASSGMIGFCTTSWGRPRVAARPAGSAVGLDSASAWAFPAAGREPVVLEQTPAACSWQALERRRQYGFDLPSGVAMQESGAPAATLEEVHSLTPHPPLDQNMALLLPTLLSGLLAGGKSPLKKRPVAELDGAEHFLQVINPSGLGLPGDYAAAVADWLSQVRETTGQAEWRPPGDERYDWAAAVEESGIGIHHADLKHLQRLATRFKIEFPFS